MVSDSHLSTPACQTTATVSQSRRVPTLQNLEKHGVGFEEATDVFDDDLSSTVADPSHSDSEHCGINAYEH